MTIVGHAILREAPTVQVLTLDGSKIGELRLPSPFLADLREGLVRRAYVALLSHSFQPKGTWKGSAHKYSVESLGVGLGLARIARIKARGTGKSNAGGFVPSAVGGRPTHPPVPEKVIHKEINRKELKAATLSAIAFTSSRDYVSKRGHRLPEGLELPIVVEDSLQSLKRAKELVEFLRRIGLSEELKRCSQVKIRAGRGKTRGRRYKRRVGPLIVVGKDEGISRAAGSIPGIEVVNARDLSVLHLAPGGVPGRLTIYTKSAMEVLAERFGGRHET